MKILRDNLFIYIDGRCKEINMGKKEKDTRKRVMFISSVGGHLTQLLQLKKIFNDYNYVLVTEKTGVTTNMKEKYKTEYLVYGTRKYLFGIKGGAVIESVLMRYHHGNSVCISTQSGCRMGCRFCASTLNGLDRNLTTSELLEQIYQIEKNIDEYQI